MGIGGFQTTAPDKRVIMITSQRVRHTEGGGWMGATHPDIDSCTSLDLELHQTEFSFGSVSETESYCLLLHFYSFAFALCIIFLMANKDV